MRQPNNPLHGITLEQLLTRLVEHFGWEQLGQRIRINCFQSEPSVKSSLKFLRQTPWARDKVEALYIATFGAADGRATDGAPSRATRRPPRADTGAEAGAGASKGGGGAGTAAQAEPGAPRQPFNPWLKS